MENIKILIVEDESLIALSLRNQLVKVGYTVCKLVSTGKEAIEISQKENPDIVLIDIRLPGEMDGIEAAQQIGKFSTAAIIFASGYSDPALKERALKLNPAAYLIKPLGVEDIDSVVKSVFA